MSRLKNRLGYEEVPEAIENTEEHTGEIEEDSVESEDVVSEIEDDYEERDPDDADLNQDDFDDMEDILGGKPAAPSSVQKPDSKGPKAVKKQDLQPPAQTPRNPGSGGGELDALFSKRRSREDLDKSSSDNSYDSETPDQKAIYGTEDHEDLSSESLEKEFQEIQKQHNREKTKNVLARFAILLMVAGCVYAIFLIFGVIMTDYGYNEAGEVQPQVLSVEDIKTKNSFDVIKVQYEKLRVVYEDILQLDAQLGEAVDGYAIIGGDYAGLMDETEDLGIKTDALTVESKYQPTKELMYSWIREYAWNYLVAISQALTNNDATAADTAVVYKNYMYSVFANITENVITLGSGVKGVDLDDIRSWDPDTYKQDYLNGMVS